MVRQCALGACANIGAVTSSSATKTVLKCAAMKATTIVLLALSAFPAAAQNRIMMVMRGGAGTIPRQNMTAEAEKKYREKLEEALRTGQAILARGGSSLDAVEASIRILEDSPLFNAGKGAVFTHDGRNELDAAIMDGKERRAGAVAGGTRIKKPIAAARAVMGDGQHVLLAGDGADRFGIS